MELPKAPSYACFGLAIIFGYGAIMANPLFAVLSVILLLAGIYLYEKERIRKEEKERKKDEKKQQDQDNKLLLGLGKGLWNVISK